MRIAALVMTAALGLTLAACGSDTESSMPDNGSMTDKGMDKSMDKKMDKGMDEHMSMSRSGSFHGLNGKEVSGKVAIDDGKVVLSGFASDEAPDLHLYLAKGDDEAAVMAGKTLGEVAYDEESQTFELNGIDADDYDTVIVHCDKAKAVFGAADLS